MKLAVVGDIHSNFHALQAFYRDIENQKVDGIVYTGDYVSDCAYPHNTVTLIKKNIERYPSWLIQGNRERALLAYHQGRKDWQYDSHNGSMLYTYENLTVSDKEFLFSLPESCIVDLPGCTPFLVVHGSPISASESMRPESADTNQHLEQCSVPLLVCGHTHRQFTYTFNDKMMLNPGSLGIPIHGNPNAQYAILEWIDGSWKVILKEISYDFHNTISDILSSDLIDKALFWPKCIIKTLNTGQSYIVACIQTARTFMENDGLKFNHLSIPVEYWDKAAKHLEII